VSILDPIKDRITRRATAMFKHASYPLERSLEYRGDPGLFGPGSASWQVIGDPAAFAGGIRALLVQAAHPEVAAGVADHSRYREDPMGRLSRTSNYVTATTYGAMPEVEEAVAVVERMHRRVRGVSHRGESYAADVPDFAAWVHNALTESFLTAYRRFGPRPFTEDDADRFVAEQAQVGVLLNATPVPDTATALSAWMVEHPGIGDSPGLREAVSFLADPPLRGTVRLGYRILQLGAVATIPRSLRRLLGVRRYPGAILLTRFMVWFLRWSLGSSPSWKLALVRVGADLPDGLFRQPLPIEQLDQWGRSRQSPVDNRQPEGDGTGGSRTGGPRLETEDS
jgi:uncharacterized protein (DUF2236 family)